MRFILSLCILLYFFNYSIYTEDLNSPLNTVVNSPDNKIASPLLSGKNSIDLVKNSKILNKFAIGIKTGTNFVTHFEDFKNGAWGGFLGTTFEYNINSTYGIVSTLGYNRYSYTVQDQKSLTKPIFGKINQDKLLYSLGFIIYYDLSRYLRFSFFSKIRSAIDVSLFIDTPLNSRLFHSFDNKEYDIKSISNKIVVGASIALLFSFDYSTFRNLYLTFIYSRSFIREWSSANTIIFSLPEQGQLQVFSLGVGFKLYVL